MVKIVCKLLPFANRKSHTCFQLVPKVETLNDMNGLAAATLRYFTDLAALGANYITLVEVRQHHFRQTFSIKIWFSAIYDL